MYALFIILNDLSRLDDIMQIFYEVGVGATSLDSTGMGKILLEHNEDIPIFSSIRKLVEGDQPYNKTLISVIREEKHLREVINQVNELLDFSKELWNWIHVCCPCIRMLWLQR